MELGDKGVGCFVTAVAFLPLTSPLLLMKSKESIQEKTIRVNAELQKICQCERIELMLYKLPNDHPAIMWSDDNALLISCEMINSHRDVIKLMEKDRILKKRMGEVGISIPIKQGYMG